MSRLILPRRKFLLAGAGLLAAPAIVRAGSLRLLGAGASGGGGGGGTTTLDPSNKGSNITLSNGNLTAAAASSANTVTRSIASHSSGKYYFEWHLDAKGGIDVDSVGAVNASEATYVGATNNSVGYFYQGGAVTINNITVATIQTMASGDFGCGALDVDNRKIYFRKGAAGLWNNSGTDNPATNTGGISISAVTGTLFMGTSIGNSGDTTTFNFGASAYTGTPPSGFGNW